MKRKCGTDADCQAWFTCISGWCEPRYGLCVNENDCKAEGMTCIDGGCTELPCDGDKPVCSGVDSVKKCVDGHQKVEKCPDGQRCRAGACVAQTAPPEERRTADEYVDSDCSANGRRGGFGGLAALLLGLVGVGTLRRRRRA